MQRRNDELLKAIAARLKELREKRGLSQRIVYIDKEINIGKLEVGKTNISVSTLSDLCDYYKISLEEFFAGIYGK